MSAPAGDGPGMEPSPAAPRAPEEQPQPVGWARAVVSALVVLAVGAALLVVAPNWALEHLTGMSRHGRVTVATCTFAVAFGVLAWGLRRLQARRVI